MVRKGRSGWLVFLALALGGVAASLFFPHLGAEPLFGDEAIHALVARESAQRDDWLPLTYDGSLYLAKPPLKILAVAWLFDRFGASELNARVLDAALGVATVVLVFLIGTRLWSAAEGALAALLLATAESYVFDHGVRSGVQDSALVFLLTAGIGLYFVAREPGEPPRRWPLAASGLALGLAALVKGAAAALALPVLAAWELARGRDARGVRGGRGALAGLAGITLLALACYGVWLVAADSWSDGKILSFLYRDVWVRVSESIDPTHVHGPAFYPLQLASDFGWWLLALVPALVALVRRPEEAGPADRKTGRDGLLLALLWAGVMLALLSLSRSKLPWYLYPAYPGVALVLARGTGEAVRWAARVRVPARALAVVLAALAAFGVWQRVERVRERLDDEPRVVHAERYARVIAELPRAEVVIARRAPLRAWDLYYLAPLARRTNRLPEVVREPAPGLCRFLVRRDREPPAGVVARPPVPALPLAPGESDRSLWLLDLDVCLPVWL